MPSLQTALGEQGDHIIPQWLPADRHTAQAWDNILRIRKSRREKLRRNLNEDLYRKMLEAETFKTSRFDFQSDIVSIGSAQDLSRDEKELLLDLMKTFMPWKKGPFELFGQTIDAEWRSEKKWQRFLEFAPQLEEKTIADIGCNNGYFMFRMQALKPRYVVGIEPVAKHWQLFSLLNSWTNQNNLFFEPLGVEHMGLLENCFDHIFCLGILYHHTDPVGILRKIKKSLKKGGKLWIDCQGIHSADDIALVPKGRYAGAKGIWFLPSMGCLTNWIKRAGFQNFNILYNEPLSIEEQRATEWAPIKSLTDYLDPTDSSKTIEGYPAPYRFYLSAW